MKLSQELLSRDHTVGGKDKQKMHIYIYMYTHKYIYIYIYTYIYMYTQTHMQSYENTMIPWFWYARLYQVYAISSRGGSRDYLM